MGGCKHPPQQTPLWQKATAILVWILIWQLAAMGLGHGGLFLATPLQTLGALAQLAPTAAFWQRIVFSALRIMAGFLLAAAGGLLLGAAGARWHWVRVFIDPAMQLIRAMPVASFVILALLWVRSVNLSVIVSFTHVLPVVYAGVLGGIADTDPKLLEMAKVYRLPLTARLRYIWLPGIFPSFCESCIAAMGMCWKSGVSAEVIKLESVKPVRMREITASVRKTGRLLVAEDAICIGCAGKEILSQLRLCGIRVPTRLCNLGDRFVTHGKVQELQRLYGLDAESLAKQAQEVLHET